jgi:Flp pilus assembly protein TadD
MRTYLIVWYCVATVAAWMFIGPAPNPSLPFDHPANGFYGWTILFLYLSAIIGGVAGGSTLSHGIDKATRQWEWTGRILIFPFVSAAWLLAAIVLMYIGATITEIGRRAFFPHVPIHSHWFEWIVICGFGAIFVFIATAIVLSFLPADAQNYADKWGGFGNEESERERLSRLVELKPNAKNYYERGLLRRREGAREEALVDFDAAIRLDPSFAKAYYYRGLIYREMGEANKAISDASDAIRLDPKFADAFSLRGWSHFQKNYFEPAIQDFSEAIRLTPREYGAHVGRGASYYKKAEYDRAIADLNESARLNRKDSSSFIWRGVAYLAKDMRNEAIEDFRKASKLGNAEATSRLKELGVEP